jgi:transcriptional regulator with XRE-family HTH domain
MIELLRLKMLREESKISQQKLADAIGMSQSSVNDYENRGIEPDIATLIRIADYFETSVDYVVAHTTIRRRIEEVSAFDLNEREAAHITGYRRLDAQSRDLSDALIAEMLRPKS